MKQLLSILFFLTSILTFGQTKATGDSALAAKDYNKAIEIYEKVVKTELNTATYNNLASAYYRTNNIPKAILNYQRALKIDASNDVANYNLKVCNAKLQDRFGKPEGLFFVTWIAEIVASESARTWGGWAMLAMVLALICFAAYKYLNGVTWRKVAFFSMTLFALMMFFFHIFAAIQAYKAANVMKAVLMKPESMYDSPSKQAKVLTSLHEGVTVVLLTEINKDGFVLIELPDEKEGWMKANALEKI